MREILLDGSKLDSAEAIHNLLAKELAFPDYYGRNLDALWDCLEDCWNPPLAIRWVHYAESRSKLGSQNAEALLQLLLDFQNEHKDFSIISEE
ncbi:barstar family protein [Paenibacillus pasadenensis]|uniref:barstar family protein n=1 Tax=Paenibacillus pasadenensis TaxID=217090 RepID=UPI00203CA71B|nr:barstar family protein [Paenibacillus pasadenensis]MCM3747246.1 barstar family protein [Paenibacillus pasadenensis]